MQQGQALEETDPPGAKKFIPKTISVDSNHDGKADSVEYYDAKGDIVRVESDTTGDGAVDEWMYFENWKPSKKAQDTDGDGKADIWVNY